MLDAHNNSSSGSRTLELVVRNHPGVMVHVASLFARRAFNLEGILCGPLGRDNLSCMMLLLGADARLDQVVQQLKKLQDVLEVHERPELSSRLFEPASWCETRVPSCG